MVVINHYGVEPSTMRSAMLNPAAAVYASAIRRKPPRKVMMLAFSDSDRLSGVALRLLAYEKFLEEHPPYRGAVSQRLSQ